MDYLFQSISLTYYEWKNDNSVVIRVLPPFAFYHKQRKHTNQENKGR